MNSRWKCIEECLDGRKMMKSIIAKYLTNEEKSSDGKYEY